METSDNKIKGAWFWTILVVLFVPLPWYVCLFGCEWVLAPLLSNFAWFRLMFITPWAEPLTLLLPVIYAVAIHWILNRLLQKLTKRTIFILIGAVAALFIIRYFIYR